MNSNQTGDGSFSYREMLALIQALQRLAAARPVADKKARELLESGELTKSERRRLEELLRQRLGGTDVPSCSHPASDMKKRLGELKHIRII